MRLSLIQTDIVWENIERNLHTFTTKMDQCENSDIIVLPEMFTTGFSLNVEDLAESMSGDTLSWMKEQAYKLKVLIIGSVIIKENNHFFNRCLCVFPDGKVEYYDKNHLFSYGNEDKFFTSGSKNIIINYKGWRIKPMICYDLRFPVAARNTENYDILIYVASWPAKRIHAWNTLLPARAIENQAYVVGVNRIGVDGMNLIYDGNSTIIDYKGELIISSQKDEILSTDLKKEELKKYRSELPFLKDMDLFSIQNI